jgi:hypothetical protein
MDMNLCAFAPLREIKTVFLALVACLSSCAALAQEAGKTQAKQTLPPPPAFAEPADESAQYTIETAARGLDNPCGLTVRPGTPAGGAFELFVSESGAGRIVRLTTDKPGEATPAVTGFPLSTYGDKPPYKIGPLGLEFITRAKLAVGTGGLANGEDLVQVYGLPADGAALTYEQADHRVGPVPPSPRSKTGEGNFFGLAKIDDDAEKALFVTSNGDDAEGWVLKASMSANKLAGLQPFIPTRRITGVPRPTAVTVNPKPRSHYLLVGQMGEAGGERDSVVTFYGPASGEAALSLKAGLYDVTGLAYSSSGDLYALDFAWSDPQAGGVYRIDAAEVDGRQSCRAVKIAAVERPTALAFTPDGVLYVTAFGNRNGVDAPPTGVLLKILPGPGTPKL